MYPIASMPKKYIEGIKTEPNEMLNCETLNEAREKRDAIIADYSDIAESAMVCLDEGFDDAMTVMVLPKRLRKNIETRIILRGSTESLSVDPT